MIEDALKKALKNSKDIQPSDELRDRLSRLVTLSPQNKLGFLETVRYEFAENASFSAALALASILVAVAVGGFTYWSKGPGAVARNTEFEAETQALDFQIQLGEVQYLNDSAAEITAYLQEIQNYDF